MSVTRVVLVSVVAAAALALVPAPSEGVTATCTVSNRTSGGAVTADLQMAINDASRGDVLLVRGVCTGEFRITTSLRIRGPARHRAMLTAAGGGRVVTIGNNSSRDLTVGLINLTVARGDTRGVGGGIRSRRTDLRLTNTVVTRNTAYRGGGVWSSGHLTLVSSTVARNVADDGGGILARGRLDLRGSSRVQYNQAGWAAGIWMLWGRTLMTGRSRVAYNEGTSASGVAGGSLQMRQHANIIRNTSTSLAGGVFTSNGSVVLRGHSSVRRNSAGDEGGGIVNYGGPVILEGGSRVAANVSTGKGGGLLVYGPVSLRGHSSVIRNLAQRGAGVMVLGASVTMADSAIVADNRAGRSGGGILAIGKPRPSVRVLEGAAVRQNDPQNILVRVRPVSVPQA
jgi:hypothetical protein